jgi:hypothetical protein
MQVNWNGKQVEARVVDYLARKEDFNEYQILDGKILKIKFVVTRMLEIKGEKNPDGSQVYQFSFQPVIAPLE